MGISLSDLSPKAQEQVKIKMAIAEARKRQKSFEKQFADTGKKDRKLHEKPVDCVLADGTPFTFDSKREYKRYQELALMEKSGQISDLQLQVKYTLIPAQREPDYMDYSKSKQGKLVKGKVIEREMAYIADFVYQKDGETVVEDAKGYRNPASAPYKVFVCKRKLMLWLYGIKVQEV